MIRCPIIHGGMGPSSRPSERMRSAGSWLLTTGSLAQPHEHGYLAPARATSVGGLAGSTIQEATRSRSTAAHTLHRIAP